MLDARQLELDVTPRETYWPLDPAIDLAASDVEQWYQTGDGLQMQERMKASKIRWRPLTLLEQTAIYTSGVNGFGTLMLLCAHALISVDGLKLERERVGLLWRVEYKSLARFELMGGVVPGLQVKKGGTPVTDDDGKPVWQMVSPVVWLGGLVDQASFRPGG